MNFAGAAAVLSEGIAARAFPAAVVEVGSAEHVIWRRAFGALTYDTGAPPVDEHTIFDLASLTKAVVTGTLAMRAVDAGTLRIGDPVAQWLPAWRGGDREHVTIADLLAHASGLPAYLPYYRNCTGRAEFEAEICSTALEYAPRTAAIYSDLGFILLGFVLEDAEARRTASLRPPGTLAPAASLAAQFRTIASYVSADPLTFTPRRDLRDRIAPTEFDRWRGRLLAGEVHDENAWALGGIAGHAGLFGTVPAVGGFARAALRTIRGDRILADPGTFRAFMRRTDVPGSSRALAWDTMLPTSSCGTKLSATAIGHTGFTGTSLWIDWERDFYVVLLTNRVHPTRENDRIRAIRPRVHDAIVDALDRG